MNAFCAAERLLSVKNEWNDVSPRAAIAAVYPLAYVRERVTGIELTRAVLPGLQSNRFGAHDDAKCDLQMNFRGRWGHVGMIDVSYTAGPASAHDRRGTSETQRAD